MEMMKMKTELITALNWRYATKQFDPKRKVSEEDFKEIAEALRLSPSSFGLQPWKFVVVENPAARAKLKEHAWGQSQVVEASHMIVLCARTDLDEKLISKYIDTIAKTRGVPRESMKSFEDMLLGFRKGLTSEAAVAWAKNQVYIALGVLLEACALKGIDACPMEGFDRQKFDEILGLKEKNLTSAVMCTIGYRLESDKYAAQKKVRFSSDEVLVRVK